MLNFKNKEKDSLASTVGTSRFKSPPSQSNGPKKKKFVEKVKKAGKYVVATSIPIGVGLYINHMKKKYPNG